MSCCLCRNYSERNLSENNDDPEKHILWRTGGFGSFHLYIVIAQGEPFEFSHSLDDQIGGQLAAGFLLTGFYEDTFGEEAADLVSKYIPDFIATRAIKTDFPSSTPR